MSYRIMLTNDDGIHSPGLAAVAQAVADMGEVRVFAPLHQQTAMGRARSGPLEACLEPVDFPVPVDQAWACDASPAAVVSHAFRVYTEYRPDLLISGINYGENIGVNASGSGTVGAALEAACLGIPALAMSLETGIDAHFNHTEENWEAAGYFTRLFAEKILRAGLPQDVHILKVEVPASATRETPWKVTRLTPTEYYTGVIDSPCASTPRSDVVKYKRDCRLDEPDTDGYAISVDGVVAVTPLTVDFTSRIPFADLTAWLDKA